MDRYLLFGLRQVEGWLDPTTAELIVAVSDIQLRAGYRGAVGEIGVHHGKLFIVLRLAADPDEPAFVVDVFEDQALNLDRSGSGDRQILEANLKRWCGSMAGITVIAKSSLEVAPHEILAAGGQVRLASIDGWHTAEYIYNDLKLMDAVTPDWGVVGARRLLQRGLARCLHRRRALLR